MIDQVVEFLTTWGSIAIGFLAIVILFLGFRGWTRAWEHHKRNLPLISAPYTSPPPVTLLDLLALFLAQVAAEYWALTRAGLKGATSLEDLTDLQQLSFLFSLNIARLTVFVVGTAALYVKYRAYFPHGGIRFLLRDVSTGALAFCMIAPVVYGMQMVLSAIWKPSQHPIISLLQEANNQWAALAICGVAAVLAAPLFEELVFRRLLHGWLDRIAASKSDDWMSLLFFSEQTEPTKQVTDDASDETLEPSDALKPITQFDTAPHLPLWPLYVSSCVFALLHLNGGPDPIPLFFFALWLAYLYRITGRITPCIVVHLLLNLYTFSMLAIEVIR